MKKCPNNLVGPRGSNETCPRCGKLRKSSGVDGGSWVHYKPHYEPTSEELNNGAVKKEYERIEKYIKHRINSFYK